MLGDRPTRELTLDGSRVPLASDLLLSIADALVPATRADIDQAIRHTLGELRRYLDADRAYVFFYTDDGSRLTATHDACRAGTPSMLAQMRGVPTSAWPWSMAQLQRDEIVEAPSPDALPESAAPERQAMRDWPLASFLTIPLTSAGRVVGGMGFDWLATPGHWTTEQLETAQIVGRLVAGAVDRGRQEDARRAAEDRLRAYIAHTSDPMCCLELPGGMSVHLPVDEQCERIGDARLVDCNEAYARLRGGTIGELLGRRARDLGDLEPDIRRQLNRRFVASGYRIDGVDVEQVVDRETVVRAYRAHGVVEHDHLTLIWASLHDVTARRQSEWRARQREEQSRQAQRMESLGLLAGGIAHDFNNILTAMMGYTQLAERRLRSDPEQVPGYLDQVLASAESASRLTRQLLLFSRRTPARREPLDLGPLAQRMLDMLGRLLPESISVDVTVADDTPSLVADAGQIEQLLTNLLINAGDAIDAVGKVTVRLGPKTVTAVRTALVGEARPGRYAELVVADEGRGIDPDVLPRIFDPFFTTKPADRGTGLGLATIYGIVQQHEGYIDIETAPGAGTTVTVGLPVTSLGRPPSGELQTLEGAPAGRGERILFAEDDADVRESVALVLAEAGYQVTLARDGAAAIKVFDRAPDAIDLALLDSVMPERSGHEVFQHLQRVRPDLRVLFTSGYPSDVFPPDFLDEHADGLLLKPFDRGELLRRVRAVLDARET